MGILHKNQNYTDTVYSFHYCILYETYKLKLTNVKLTYSL